jgi:hypothetical protein
MYLHEHVKTTPFYQLVLDLLARSESLHIAEQRLLSGFLRSVPKMSKQTPTEFIAEVEKLGAEKLKQDLEPYRKAHIEHMPNTTVLDSSGIISVICDESTNKPTDKFLICSCIEKLLL